MTTVEATTAAIAGLPPEQVGQVRAWFDGRPEAGWDARIGQDARSGKLDALAERALEGGAAEGETVDVTARRVESHHPGSGRIVRSVGREDEWILRLSSRQPC